MPLEILEKVIGFALPDRLTIAAAPWRPCWTWKQPFEFWWDPSWVTGLLLVSKRIGRVARKILSQRTWLDFYSHATCYGPVVSGRAKREARAYFGEFFEKDDPDLQVCVLEL
jgi:hypothetical protein